MSDKLHSLTVVVRERVSAELLLNRSRPGEALWSWPLFCAEGSEYCCGCLPPTTWGKQSKVPYSAPIAFGDVLRPAVDELLDRALLRWPSVSALVLGRASRRVLSVLAPVPIPEQYKSIRDGKDAPLRDGRTPRIAPGVTQEVLFLVEGLQHLQVTGLSQLRSLGHHSVAARALVRHPGGTVSWHNLHHAEYVVAPVPQPAALPA